MYGITYEQKQSIGLSFVLDNLSPVSAFGIQKARRPTFFTPDKKNLLQAELDNIEKIFKHFDDCREGINELRHTMSMTNNIIKSIGKTATEVLDDVELFEIKCFLLQCEKIKKLFDQLNRTLCLLGIEFSDTTRALDIVDPEKTRIASFYISDSCSARLRELRAKKARIEQQISVTPKQSAGSLISQHTEIAKQEESEELNVRVTLSKALAPFSGLMRKNAEQIAAVDIFIAKAALAQKFGAVKPTLSDEKQITVKDMFNPFLSEKLAERGEKFTPVSISCPSGVTIVTGANMGGKSVAVKTLALNVMLMQLGFFVFAEYLSAPLFEFFSLSVSEAENANTGLSAFGGEIVRLNDTYQKAKKAFGLIVIDEFAKGTNVTEGQAIFCAVVEALNSKNSVSIMTTHYDDVSKKANRHYQVAGLKNFDENYAPSKNIGDNILYLAKRMNYGLIEVPLNSNTPKEATAVCVALGLDGEITAKIKRDC